MARGVKNMQASSSERNFDVVVLGGGIAGSAISFLLQAQQGLSVAIVDPRLLPQSIMCRGIIF